MAKLNYERAASILVEAAFLDDGEVAKKYGISTQTLTNYRKRLRDDPYLSTLYHKKMAVLEQEWATELSFAIREAIRFLRRAARSATPGDPHSIHAVAGALKILSEVSATKKLIDARLSGQDRAQLAEGGQMAPSIPAVQARA